jgi:hypothetical protein
MRVKNLTFAWQLKIYKMMAAYNFCFKWSKNLNFISVEG